MVTVQSQEAMMHDDWRDRWLQAAIAAVMVYSLGLVVAGGVVTQLFEVLGFGMADAGITGGDDRGYVLFAYGVLGSVLVGWMITLLQIARGPLHRRDRSAWTTIVVAVSIWFVLDTSFSIVMGSVPHALFNVGFLAALSPPLIAMRSELVETTPV